MNKGGSGLSLCWRARHHLHRNHHDGLRRNVAARLAGSIITPPPRQRAAGSGNALTTNGTGTFDINGVSSGFGTVTNGGVITSSSGTPTLTIGAGSTGAGAWTGTMNVVWNQGAAGTNISGNWMNTGNITLNANAAGTIALSGAVNNTGTVTNSGIGSGATTISGTISPNVTGVVQNSATSALNLTIAEPYFTGGVTDMAGVVTPTTATSLGTGTFTMGAVGGSANTQLNLNFNSATISNPISVAMNYTGTALIVGNANNFQTPTVSGAITLNNSNISLESLGNGDNITFSGSISGAGNVNVVLTSQPNAGTVTLSGASLNNVGAINVNGSGNNSSSISGAIGNNVTNVIINTTSSGQNTVSNASNSFSGNLLVQQGKASVNSNGAAAGHTVFLGTAGTSNNASLALGNGSSLTFSDPISTVTGGTDSGTITLSFGSNNNGGVTVSGPITLSNGDNLTIQWGGGNGKSNLITGGVTGTGNIVIGNTTGTSDSLTIQTGLINNVGTLTEASTAAGGGMSISAVIGSNVTQIIQNSTAESLSLSGANTAGGATVSAGTLTVNGPSVTTGSGAAMTITSAPTGVGLVAVNAGTLNLNNQSRAVGGGLSGSGGSVTNNGATTNSTLTIVTGATARNYSGVISSGASKTVSLAIAGNGFQMLSGANTYTGTTAINASTLGGDQRLPAWAAAPPHRWPWGLRLTTRPPPTHSCPSAACRLPAARARVPHSARRSVPDLQLPLLTWQALRT